MKWELKTRDGLFEPILECDNWSATIDKDGSILLEALDYDLSSTNVGIEDLLRLVEAHKEWKAKQ